MEAELPILEGDELRIVWEELSFRERRRVYRAVRRAEAIQDPGFASLAVSVARREQRQTRSAVIAFALILLFGTSIAIWAVRSVHFSSRSWLSLLGVIVPGVIVPIVHLLLTPSRRRRAHRAEELNVAVMRGHPSDAGLSREDD